MSPLLVAALALVNELLPLIPVLISAGQNVAGLIDKIKGVQSASGAPTDAQWTDINTLLDQYEVQLNKDPVLPVPATGG